MQSSERVVCGGDAVGTGWSTAAAIAGDDPVTATRRRFGFRYLAVGLFLGTTMTIAVGCASRVVVIDVVDSGGAETADTNDAGGESAARLVDAQPGDGGDAHAECALASDCLGSPPSGNWCTNSNWSCILGQCTWECAGGRECELRPGDCVACSGAGIPAQSGCSVDPCVPAALPPLLMGATCRRPIRDELSSCFARFVRRTDGTLCTVQELGVGTGRYAVACGPCQFVFGN